MGLRLLSSKKLDAHQVLSDTLAALDRSQALIEFKPDGSVITANEKFLTVLGYSLAEVQGEHHSMFVDPDYANSEDYKTFWSNLRAGQHQTAQFKRIGKAGREVWIEASYNPLVGRDGKVYRVVKNAIDVTQQYHAAADAKGQLAAISRSQAVIEFNLDGTITAANQNFCQALGYAAHEIIGRHHSMFVRPDEVAKEDYREFWRGLARGEFHAAEFLRIGKGGREVWIQASYNPIFDASGRPFKVVKYATDVTARKTAVNLMGEALARLANGDLTCAINQVFPGDLESVRESFNITIQQFGKMVSELRQTSSALRSATGEILSGANDLADRTTKQAAAIEETSAAVEQLSGTVKLNAQRAHTAEKSAQEVSGEAELTGLTMGQANFAMAEVTNQSKKISGIIGLIDDIAFQTNLLALNASVEAARAGDAGKGFAVVAVEVRRLAQSAASASKDVKGLIEQSGEAVALGSKLVAEATERLTGMVSGVQENARIMSDIAVASSEQANALTEVNTAVREMDEMTQHNAALVEEINAAIEQTEGQASKVDSLVEVFDVGTSYATAQTSPAKTNSRVPTKKIYVVGSNALKADWDEF